MKQNSKRVFRRWQKMHCVREVQQIIRLFQLKSRWKSYIVFVFITNLKRKIYKKYIDHYEDINMKRETKVKNFIGGKWVASKSEKVEPVYNPATGEVIAEVPLSTTGEVDEAVKVADAAFQDWRKKPVPQRARILFKYQQLLVD